MLCQHAAGALMPTLDCPICGKPVSVSPALFVGVDAEWLCLACGSSGTISDRTDGAMPPHVAVAIKKVEDAS